jgi:hypothetical protein
MIFLEEDFDFLAIETQEAQLSTPYGCQTLEVLM